ncbi:MAG: glyoxylate/hydroxypyruvate reductase A [Methylobacterium frigidaeris]
MPPETLVFFSEFDTFEPWRDALRAELPDLTVERADAIPDPAPVRYALVWKPPQDFFGAYPNLALITNLGAGTDALIGRDDLPDVPVARLSDPAMGRMMAGYVLFAVLRYAREIPVFEAAQRGRRWEYRHPRPAEEIRVGVLGLGELGGMAAEELARQGFTVSGWSRTPRTVPGVRTVAGIEALPDFLAGCEIVVVMLPLTPQTHGLLDRAMLARLPAGAKVVNVGRGGILDEAALREGLVSGRIGGATLDVFAREPLPADDPLWDAPNLLITPHLASIGLPRSAAPQIADNIRRLRAGEPIRHRVDPGRGY